MHQQQFEKLYEPAWIQLNLQLNRMKGDKETGDLQGADSSQGHEFASFPANYKKICNHYALARSRHYSPTLVARLHQLVLMGHQQLYKTDRSWFRRSLIFIAAGFPQALRQNIRFFYLALLIFLLPATVVGYFTYHDRGLIYSIMDDRQVGNMEYMYDPQNKKPGRDVERTSETNVQMFGFYIMHNISIGFRTFAGGMLLGVGAVFSLFFNGMMLGGISGHLSHTPYGMVFWPFVAGHGSFELTAIVISGAAGLILASALVMPGSMTRGAALRKCAPASLQLVMGAAFMLVIAAFIEAFWSPSAVSPGIRFAVAGLLWSLVVLYFIFGGRNHGS